MLCEASEENYAMVRNSHSDCAVEVNPQQTQQLRQQADALLQHLIEGREQSNRRLAELGQRDAMKCVTGRSAIEQAIATTRCMIDDMDVLLEQMNADLNGASNGSHAHCDMVGAGSAG